ncbi:unnamed protein product [Paramecium sonneborni]|uniref:non-specific serine/threonine protein kinase n=1 Tax=Paramecium sonneborni TaxID=65129 RepID=A0A8S1LGB9_9CILI|nr:unnamed protein product [Paramecium sonneborni]
MNQSNNSYFYEIPNRNDILWKRMDSLQVFELVRSLNQDHQQNKIYSINGQDELIEKPHYNLKNQYLQSKNKYLNLENLILKKTMKDHYYGLELSTNYETLYLYGCKDIIEEWYSYIKIYTIQNDFRMNYDFIKLTGKGAHAKVYKVYCKRDNQIYAVKVFKKKNINNKFGLFKEIQILRQLQHKNVIRLNEVYENAKHLYLILDYLAGGELLSAISQTEVYSETVVQELIQNLLIALDYIHQNKILHRDIKPQNLLLRSLNNITDLVIADFGLSDEYNCKGEYIFQKCGTIGYIAPEILRNEIYDYKVDIFSVGVIMFMLLTDSSPFDGKNTDEVITNNFYCKINFEQLTKSKISTHAYDFVKLLLEQNPNLRPTAQEALKHDWFYLPKMETLQFFSLSLKNIPLFNIKKRPQLQQILISQSPLWNNLGSKLSLSDSSKSKNGSECLSILDDIQDQVQEEETQVDYKYQFKLRQSSIDENLEEMNDNDFYKYTKSPASLLQIYHLSIKGGRQ